MIYNYIIDHPGCTTKDLVNELGNVRPKITKLLDKGTITLKKGKLYIQVIPRYIEQNAIKRNEDRKRRILNRVYEHFPELRNILIYGTTPN